MKDLKFPFVYLKTNKTRDSNPNQATTSTMTYTTSSLYSSFQVITTFTTIPMMPITWITTESKQRSLMDKFTPMERRRTPVRKRKDRREREQVHAHVEKEDTGMKEERQLTVKTVETAREVLLWTSSCPRRRGRHLYVRGKTVFSKESRDNGDHKQRSVHMRQGRGEKYSTFFEDITVLVVSNGDI